jgi:catechol 2,3-dioxygenase-like lactoylglutathione lyase family enzyme
LEEGQVILRLHHAQMTIPSGAENVARGFYSEFLGLREVEKPEGLKANGGLWMQLGDLQIHFGIQDEVDRKASRVHLAFEVDDLLTLRRRLEERGFKISVGKPLPGYDRFETRDPFGNRIEFLEKK